MNMQKTTIVYGTLLILLGIIGYFASGQVSLTALIPAFPGVVIVLLGVAAGNESRRKHVMHGVVVLAAIAFFGSISGFEGLFTMISGGEVERPGAAIGKSVMALLSLGFVLLCIKSFRDARKKQAA